MVGSVGKPRLAPAPRLVERSLHLEQGLAALVPLAQAPPEQVLQLVLVLAIMLAVAALGLVLSVLGHPVVEQLSVAFPLVLAPMLVDLPLEMVDP